MQAASRRSDSIYLARWVCLYAFNKIKLGPHRTRHRWGTNARLQARGGHVISTFRSGALYLAIKIATRRRPGGRLRDKTNNLSVSELWFAGYKRGRRGRGTDSSAFEHVFVGETRAGTAW